jgi:hypothetical protein
MGAFGGTTVLQTATSSTPSAQQSIAQQAGPQRTPQFAEPGKRFSRRQLLPLHSIWMDDDGAEAGRRPVFPGSSCELQPMGVGILDRCAQGHDAVDRKFVLLQRILRGFSTLPLVPNLRFYADRLASAFHTKEASKVAKARRFPIASLKSACLAQQCCQAVLNAVRSCQASYVLAVMSRLNAALQP